MLRAESHAGIGDAEIDSIAMAGEGLFLLLGRICIGVLFVPGGYGNRMSVPGLVSGRKETRFFCFAIARSVSRHSEEYGIVMLCPTVS